MLKKFITLSILASLISASSNVFAQTQCQNNKRPMTQEQDCCCKAVETNSYVCKPMTAKIDKKCPGVILDSLTQTQKDEDAKYKTKISTQKDDSCICEFKIQ